MLDLQEEFSEKTLIHFHSAGEYDKMIGYSDNFPFLLPIGATYPIGNLLVLLIPRW